MFIRIVQKDVRMLDPTFIESRLAVVSLLMQWEGQNIRGAHSASAESQTRMGFFFYGLRFTVFAGLTILRNKQILDHITHMIEICLFRKGLSELPGQRSFPKSHCSYF
jgi:hypothetical protein